MRTRRRFRLSWLLFGLAPIVLVLSVAAAFQQPSTIPPAPVRVAPAQSVPPLSGGQVSLTRAPGTTLTPKPLEVHASPMVAMRLPAIGLKLRVEGYKTGSPIDPPFDPSRIASLVYQDTSRGSNPGTDATNATFIEGHTWRAGPQAAFNRVDTSLRLGDDIYVMTKASRRLGVWLHYVVSWKHIYPKATLARKANPFWRVKPRLVLITCHLNADGSLQDSNRVFMARLVGTTK